ncbi:MAG TPA: nitrilase-related carbon-nitrogen hydrolase, partial [Myxococcota bacterium]
MKRVELLAVGQMTSTKEVDQNLATCGELASSAQDRGAKLLCLPECFAFMGHGDVDTRAVMEPLEGPLFARYREIARAHKIWVSFGGFPERVDADHNHNAHVIVDDSGAIRAVYRKIHLFDVTLPNGSVYKESAVTSAGKDVVVTDSPVGALGLSVCYDLRFPELYRALAMKD